MNERTSPVKQHYSSFAEFYEHYLLEHQNRSCRQLHFFGTSVVIALLISAFYSANYWLLALMPLAGYGPSWFGHFVFEKNKPTTFYAPIQSLLADCLMYWHTVTLQLPGKMEAAIAKLEMAQKNT